MNISNATPIMNAKELVAGMRAVQAVLNQYEPPKKGRRPSENRYDPNAYFGVLQHIATVPKHTLDFIYHRQDIGGEPCLYCRRQDSVPLQFYPQYAAWRRRRELLEFLVADGTPQAFFELVVFCVMANQFAQDWHACYNDHQFVTAPDEIEILISGINSKDKRGRKITEEQVVAIRAFELQPIVETNESTVSVFYSIFSKWGGLARQKMTFKRTPPHRIVEEITKAKVGYDCGILF